MPADPFTNSLDVHAGPAQPVEIEFAPDVADYVRTREWHRSQEIEDRADGTIVLRLEVSIDRPLRRWVLSFGASARVVSPAALASEIAELVEAGVGRVSTSPGIRRGRQFDTTIGMTGSPALSERSRCRSR